MIPHVGVVGKQSIDYGQTMRLARFRTAPDAPAAVGLVEGDTVVRLDVPDDMVAVLEDLPSLPPRAEAHSLTDVHLLAPIARPPKFLAIGLNYRDHCEETGMPAPEWPVFFNKQSTCVIGPTDDIVKPAVSDMVDYEGELGVVIGQRCRHVTAERAHEVIAGFLVVNDVTVRDWQLRSPTMTMGKSFDTHGPIGPWIVTADELGDPNELSIRTFVNDQQVQDLRTSNMIFDIGTQVETLTTAFTLEPGDIISTGTGAGVGIVRRPPLFLKVGDVCRVEIDGIGELVNHVVADPATTR